MTAGGSRREQAGAKRFPQKKTASGLFFFAYLQVFFLLIIITIRFQILSINTIKCFPDYKL